MFHVEQPKLHKAIDDLKWLPYPQTGRTEGGREPFFGESRRKGLPSPFQQGPGAENLVEQPINT